MNLLRVIIISVFILSIRTAFSQCTGPNGQYPFTPVILEENTCDEMIITGAWPGEYSLLQNAKAGYTYRFSSSKPTDYITIQDSLTNEFLAFGIETVTLTLNSNNSLKFWRHSNISCGVIQSQRTLRIEVLNGVNSAFLFNPITSDIYAGSKNARILNFYINSCNQQVVTSLNVSTTGSTNTAQDIVSAKLYYSESGEFSTANQFGETIYSPNGSFILNDVQVVNWPGGYFYLVYDLKCDANVGNVIDAQLNSIVINNETIQTVESNPDGSRTIIPYENEDNIQTAGTYIWGGTNLFDMEHKVLQENEPLPINNTLPYNTNGNSASNYSWNGTHTKTQWYKLIIPTSGLGSSGNLLIRAVTVASSIPESNIDVACWRFPNMTPGTCYTEPDFSDGYLLAANANAFVHAPGYTQGSQFNSIIRVRLTPGETYYIEIGGFVNGNPFGELIIEDLADPAGKNVPNNGFGLIHNPVGIDMRYASYEVVGDDNWTYYYHNNGTSNTIADDPVLMGINWGTSNTYLWRGVNTLSSDLLSHVRRDARSSVAPSMFGPYHYTTSDAFVVWSGRNSIGLASGDLKLTAPYVQSTHWLMMNKFWNIFPNVQPLNPIGVRTFYHEDEFNALQLAITGVPGATPLISHDKMQFIKITKSPVSHFTNFEMNPGDGHGAITLPSVSHLPWINTDNVMPNQPDIHMAEFNINGFSGGGGGGGGTPQGPLPVNIISFTAKGNNNSTVTLNWNVGQEIDVKFYNVESSIDNQKWIVLGKVTAQQLNTYSFVDSNPVKGLNYYRLAIEDQNASMAYSQVRSVNFSGRAGLALYPNPANSQVFISGSTDKNVVVSVYNEVGQIVQTLKISGDNLTSQGIDISSLLPGAYSIQIKGETDVNTMRFVKQ